MIETPPRNAQEQLARATANIAAQNAAGMKAMAEACGDEFVPPESMSQAAATILRLRNERDASARESEEANRRFEQFQQSVFGDCNAALNGNPMASDSPMAPLAEKIQRLAQQLSDNAEKHVRFSAGVRATLIDHGMIELPGIAGYFTGATPLLRAAEAGAIFVNASNQAVREAYLRRRGWVMTTNGTNANWRNPEGTQMLPLEAALARQVKADCEPFKPMADREWKGMPTPRRPEEPKIIGEAVKLVPTPKDDIYGTHPMVSDPVEYRSQPIWTGGEINSFQTQPEMTLLEPVSMEAFIPETLPTPLPKVTQQPSPKLDFRVGNNFVRSAPVRQDPRLMQGHIERSSRTPQGTIVKSIMTPPPNASPMGMRSTAEEFVMPSLGGGIAGEE
jgi:hypothetical protein